MAADNQAPDGVKTRGPVAVETVGAVTIRIYKVKAPTAADGSAYKFALPGTTRSVTKTDLGEAKIEAKRVAKAHSRGITDNVKSSDIVELNAARAIADDIGMPLLPALGEFQAAKRLAGPALLNIAKEHAAAAADGAHERVTLAEAWERFIAAKNKLNHNRAERTYTSKAKVITEGLGAGIMIDTLKTTQIEKWAEGIPHPSTRNELVKRLGTLLRWCQSHDLYPTDRVIPTDNVTSAKEAKIVIGTINAAQLKACLDYIRERHIHLLAPLALCSLSPIRSDEVHGKREKSGEPRSEMPRQRWSDIHIDEEGQEDHYHVTVAKEGTPELRLIPISPALKAWLALCPRAGEYVCKAGSMERVREILRKADVDLCFPKKKMKDDEGNEWTEQVIPENGFRRSILSALVPLVGVPRTAEIGGTSAPQIYRHYRRPMLAAEAKLYVAVMPD